MTLFEAIILGLIQGLTEFIPVSSSGHLVLAQHFFSGASEHLFLEWINIGTALALIVFFRRRIIGIFKGMLQNNNWCLARNVIITTLPAAAIGFVFADYIENTEFFGSVWIVAVMLAVVGVVMIVLPRLPAFSAINNAEALGPGRAALIGLAQAAALIPGTSRSGATIIAGRLMGLSASKAAEYSFLVSIPIMLGVIAKVSLKEGDRAYLMANLEPLVAGNLAAFISGIWAVSFLMRYLERHELAVFGWYRLGLAGVIAVIFMLQ